MAGTIDGMNLESSVIMVCKSAGAPARFQTTPAQPHLHADEFLSRIRFSGSGGAALSILISGVKNSLTGFSKPTSKTK